MNPRFVIAVSVLAALKAAAQTDVEGIAWFESEVRPLLVKHCYECHSAEAGKSKGGLRLDTREAIRAGGDLGPSVVPGVSEKSLLIQAVRYRDKDLQMPPKKPLPAEAVNLLERWVTAGAPDPREGSGGVVSAKPKGIDFAKARQHRAFQPVRESPPPAADSAWVRNDIAPFILARLQKEGWQPGEEADARSLVRRTYVDLTGLPPTFEEVAAYANDPAPDRFDLKSRGLLEDTLVIWAGEFGRTPTVQLAANGQNVQAGRDHNRYGFTSWMVGGGVKGGLAHGQTDEFGFAAVENRVHVHDLHATILHLMGFGHERLTHHHAGRDFHLTDVHGHVVKGILA